MPERRIICPVVDRLPAVTTGLEVNAFRIIPDSGDSYFLDFIHYCVGTQQAHVVHRVRLPGDALESTRDRLANDMIDVASSDVSVMWAGADASGMVN